MPAGEISGGNSKLLAAALGVGGTGHVLVIVSSAQVPTIAAEFLAAASC
ncbi:hypothetical protein ACIHIX_25500 [Streptomyces sp. NPDC051913]